MVFIIGSLPNLKVGILFSIHAPFKLPDESMADVADLDAIIIRLLHFSLL